MSRDRAYYPFSRFLRERFGGIVWRVAVDGGFTCPNVDGTVTTGGCVFCDNESFSPYRRSARRPVREQVAHGIAALNRRYGAERFLAYFQAGTNTYAPLERLKRLYDEALANPAIIGLIVGTRPDCLPDPVLDLLAHYARNRWVCLELGLQSIHERSLQWMNRGHGVDSFFDAIRRAKGRNLDLCAHVILGLPGESRQDMLATADACAHAGLQGLKIHNLHVVRETPLERMYLDRQVQLLERDEYIGIVCDFVERLPPDMVIHRLQGDAPPEYLVAPLWNLEKQSLLADIEAEFKRRGTRQGSRFEPEAKPELPRRVTLPLLE
jgi:hypothetical protein